MNVRKRQVIAKLNNKSVTLQAGAMQWMLGDISSTTGVKGLFNLGLSGTGIVVLESNVPEEELIEVVLDNDVLKVDGPLAVAWSQSLQFTVERSGKTLLGSAASGEGLVNVFRGSGRILMSPVAVSKIATGGLE